MIPTLTTPKGRLPLLLYPISLLLLLTLLTTAHAQTILPPPTVSVMVDSVYFPGTPVGGAQSNATLAFRVSPQDPDQINGTYQYRIYINVTGAAACSVPTGWSGLNITHTPIPGRPGWLEYSGGFSNILPFCPGNQFNLRFNLTAVNTSNNATSPPSCLLNITDARIVGSRDQCGANITRPPPGASGIINLTSNTTTSGNAIYRWLLSPDDNNTNAGNLTYRYLLTTPGEKGQPVILANTTDTADANDADGVRYLLQTFGGLQPLTYQFQVRAEDNLTRLVSNYSCIITLNTGNLYEQQACGLITAPGVSAGEPAFPGLDVDAFAAVSGISTSSASLLLAGALLIALSLAGFFVAGPTGTGVALALGLPFVALLNLLPTWLIIVLFAIAAGIIIMRIRNGSG